MQSVTREEAHTLIDLLPPAFTWDDLMRAIYERASVERGLADGAAGRVTAVAALRAEFKLAPCQGAPMKGIEEFG